MAPGVRADDCRRPFTGGRSTSANRARGGAKRSDGRWPGTARVGSRDYLGRSRPSDLCLPPALPDDLPHPSARRRTPRRPRRPSGLLTRVGAPRPRRAPDGHLADRCDAVRHHADRPARPGARAALRGDDHARRPRRPPVPVCLRRLRGPRDERARAEARCRLPRHHLPAPRPDPDGQRARQRPARARALHAAVRGLRAAPGARRVHRHPGGPPDARVDVRPRTGEPRRDARLRRRRAHGGQRRLRRIWNPGRGPWPRRPRRPARARRIARADLAPRPRRRADGKWPRPSLGRRTADALVARAVLQAPRRPRHPPPHRRPSGGRRRQRRRTHVLRARLGRVGCVGAGGRQPVAQPSGGAGRRTGDAAHRERQRGVRQRDPRPDRQDASRRCARPASARRWPSRPPRACAPKSRGPSSKARPRTSPP